MTDKMLKFVKIGQQTPPKREVKNRKEDFNEIYDDFIKTKSSRAIKQMFSVWSFLFVRSIVHLATIFQTG